MFKQYLTFIQGFVMHWQLLVERSNCVMLDVGIRIRTSTQKICQMQSVSENTTKVKWQYLILTGGGPLQFFSVNELNVKLLMSGVH